MKKLAYVCALGAALLAGCTNKDECYYHSLRYQDTNTNGLYDLVITENHKIDSNGLDRVVSTQHKKLYVEATEKQIRNNILQDLQGVEFE